jgi:hypothetical protein
MSTPQRATHSALLGLADEVPDHLVSPERNDAAPALQLSSNVGLKVLDRWEQRLHTTV